MCDELREGEIESLPLPKDRAESVRHAVLNVVGIVKLRVASYRHNAGFRHDPAELPKVGGPLHRVQDPLELNNLIDDPAAAEAKKELRRQMNTWIRQAPKASGKPLGPIRRPD